MVRGIRNRGNQTSASRRALVGTLSLSLVWNLAASRALSSSALPIHSVEIAKASRQSQLKVQAWRVIPAMLSVEKLLLPYAWGEEGGGG